MLKTIILLIERSLRLIGATRHRKWRGTHYCLKMPRKKKHDLFYSFTVQLFLNDIKSVLHFTQALKLLCDFFCIKNCYSNNCQLCKLLITYCFYCRNSMSADSFCCLLRKCLFFSVVQQSKRSYSKKKNKTKTKPNLLDFCWNGRLNKINFPQRCQNNSQ